ncbi:alpha/beta hydrolase family protein [Acidobacteriota bacterium]
MSSRQKETPIWQGKNKNKIVLVHSKILFENSAGIKLCGILSTPSFEKPESVIILCHGFSTSKDGRTNTLLEKILNDNGLATFRFDFFGHGESGGAFEEITISEAVDNVLQAVKFVKTSGFKRIGLIGSSFGGMASILAASQIGDLSVLALKSPVSDYTEILEQRNHGGQNIEDWRIKGMMFFRGAKDMDLKLKFAFFEDSQTIDGYRAAKKIKVPTLIVHGKMDETVPVEQSVKASQLIKNCRLEILESANHIYSQPRDFNEMIRLISDFVLVHSQNQGNTI